MYKNIAKETLVFLEESNKIEREYGVSHFIASGNPFILEEMKL